jgi:hypothetical protein
MDLCKALIASSSEAPIQPLLLGVGSAVHRVIKTEHAAVTSRLDSCLPHYLFWLKKFEAQAFDKTETVFCRQILSVSI